MGESKDNKTSSMVINATPVMFWFNQLDKCRNALKKMPSDYMFRRIMIGQYVLAFTDNMEAELRNNPIYLN